MRTDSLCRLVELLDDPILTHAAPGELGRIGTKYAGSLSTVFIDAVDSEE